MSSCPNGHPVVPGFSFCPTCGAAAGTSPPLPADEPEPNWSPPPPPPPPPPGWSAGPPGPPSPIPPIPTYQAAAPGPLPPSRPPRWPWVVAAIGVLVVVLALVLAVVIGTGILVLSRDEADPPPAPTTTSSFRSGTGGTGRTTSTTSAVSRTSVPAGYMTLTDPDTGVKLSVPKEWVQYPTKDVPDKTLRLSVGIPDAGDTVIVRVSSYESEITEANLGDQKNAFDQLLSAEKIQIFVNQTTKVGGLPALFYVYRFTDEASGKTGIHAHYFVFQGRKMVSLVFQALPETDYKALAPTFDTIANSLEVAPGPPPAFLTPVGPGSTSPPAPPTTR